MSALYFANLNNDNPSAATEASQDYADLCETHWDAIIVGGGMVGATVALGLSKENFKVLLLENHQPEIEWNGNLPFQTRVSALTRASENILKNLGAWQGILNRRLHPFTAMHVWDEVTEGEVHFSADEIGEANLGYVVENKLVQSALWEVIQNDSQVTCAIGFNVLDMSFEKQFASVVLDGVGELNTQLIVGADGAQSKTRGFAEIELENHEYQQCAVVGCVKTEKSHQDTCWQRYTVDGPFAYLAMNDNVSSIAWYLPLEKKQWALELDDDAFSKALAQASGEKLGKVIEVGERAAFPLVRRHATHYVKNHLALVGDAAHTIHPQAGQGVNLGLLDAAALVETLVNAKQEALHTQKDWSRLSVLRRYERWRRGDNAIVQRSMEGFDWLFKQDSALKIDFRKVFLPVANRFKTLKNWLMSQALNGREALPIMAKQKID